MPEFRIQGCTETYSTYSLPLAALAFSARSLSALSFSSVGVEFAAAAAASSFFSACCAFCNSMTAINNSRLISSNNVTLSLSLDSLPGLRGVAICAFPWPVCPCCEEGKTGVWGVVTAPPACGLLPGCCKGGFAFWPWTAANCGFALVAWGGVDCIFP